MLNKVWFIKTRNSPNSTQGMRHREQCAMSKELAGYGMRWVAMMPSIAGTPRSNANWTCASWLSLGASDIVKIPRSNRYPPQLATCTIARPQHQAIPSQQKPETGGSPGSRWSITKQKKKPLTNRSNHLPHTQYPEQFELSHLSCLEWVVPCGQYTPQLHLETWCLHQGR